MASRGFTLIEVMAVLVILGGTVTFLTLGFQRLESDRLEKQAGQLTGWLQAVSDDAVLDSAVYGVWYEPGGRLIRGYYFGNRWWRLGDDDLGQPRLGDGLTLLTERGNGGFVVLEQQRETGMEAVPDLLFLPSGLTEPDGFELREKRRAARIERNDDGIFTWSML